MPVAAVSRAVRPDDRPPTKPRARRTIRASPSSPDRVVEINAPGWPVPAPSPPPPGLVHAQGADGDARSEGDQRRGHDSTAWTYEHHGRIVYRHIHNLRIRWLNHVDGLARRLLHFYRMLRVAAQRSGRVGLRPKPLNRICHCALVAHEFVADCGIVVNVLRHHLEHLREVHQSNERGIKSLLLRGVGERRSREARIGEEPVIHVQNFLRIGRCGHDLRKQRIRIQRNRRQQLVQLLRRERSVLSRELQSKIVPKEENNQQEGGNSGVLAHGTPHVG